MIAPLASVVVLSVQTLPLAAVTMLMPLQTGASPTKDQPSVPRAMIAVSPEGPSVPTIAVASRVGVQIPSSKVREQAFPSSPATVPPLVNSSPRSVERADSVVISVTVAPSAPTSTSIDSGRNSIDDWLLASPCVDRASVARTLTLAT